MFSAARKVAEFVRVKRLFNSLERQRKARTLYLQRLFNSDEAPKIIATVHRGKKHEGNSGHQHTLDVSIEIFALGISFLIIVECKCYKSTVGIDDLLEFAARLDDLPVHKGIMITTVGFQEGAIKIAKANGIALITFNPKALIIHHGIDRTGFEIAPTYTEF